MPVLSVLDILSLLGGVMASWELGSGAEWPSTYWLTMLSRAWIRATRAGFELGEGSASPALPVSSIVVGSFS